MSDPSSVLSEASVIAFVPCLDRVNVQNRKFLAVSRYDDSIVSRQVVTHLTFSSLIEMPPNLQRQVTFGNRASRRNGFVQVELIVTEVERNDCWRDFEQK